MLAADGTPEAIRNRAVLVLGFTSALRRANITSLMLSDVDFTEQGVALRIRYGKCDQEGRGRSVAVVCGQHPDTCLTSCLRAWLAHRGTADGALFCAVGDRSLRNLAPSVVGRIVKAAVQRIGLDPTRYAGHSLRSAFITEAGLAGVSHLIIAAHTGHKRMDTLKKYFRPTDIWKANATGLLGL
jgi:site-specific recombinase XerD